MWPLTLMSTPETFVHHLDRMEDIPGQHTEPPARPMSGVEYSRILAKGNGTWMGRASHLSTSAFALRVGHYSYLTEKAYVAWIRRFILFHGKRHPAERGPEHVSEYLSHLAAQRKVAPAAQNQALNALLFLYRKVLGIDLPWLGARRASQAEDRGHHSSSHPSTDSRSSSTPNRPAASRTGSASAQSES